MLETAPLGKKTEYIQTYSPELLFPVSRQMARSTPELPFKGCDIWYGYELSWLNEKGRPEIALARFTVPCMTPCLVESKSFKLYLNSFNQTRFSSRDEVKKALKQDLSQAVEGPLTVELFSLTDFPPVDQIEGTSLDNLNVSTDIYEVQPDFLSVSSENVSETLYSHLLKSNCLATGQPDWGTVIIEYTGPKMDHEGLLKYIISYRNHSGFAEHCSEQMFCDILERCFPEKLSLQIFYSRRGGLDINPFRSTETESPKIHRIFR